MDQQKQPRPKKPALAEKEQSSDSPELVQSSDPIESPQNRAEPELPDAVPPLTGKQPAEGETCIVCKQPITGKNNGTITGRLFPYNRCSCMDEKHHKEADNKRDSSKTPGHSSTPSEDIGLGERYEILSELGAGGMGTVYKVHDKAIDKIIAVKLLRNDLASDKKILKRFHQEAVANKDLTHPNLVATYDDGATNSGVPYLTMDYIEGKDLATILREEIYISEQRALDIFSQTCEALTHAHAKNIVHRDVKPSNIIVSATEAGNDLVKVVDFGIAKILPSADLAEQALTSTGEVFGSPLYMSPEQGQGESMDMRSDIYSLGCVMYEALTGHVPFQGVNPVKTILKHLQQPPPAFPSDANISKPLQDVIMRCLEKDPQCRYQSAADLQRDLEAIRSHKPISKPRKAPSKNTVAKTKTKSMLVRLLAAGAIICGAGLAGAAFLNSTPVDFDPMTKTAVDAERALHNNFAKATQIYRAAAEKAELTGASPAVRVHLWLELGVLYRDWQRPGLAYPCYLKALSYDLQLPADWKRTMIYIDLCRICNDDGRFKEGVDYGEKAVKLVEQLNIFDESRYGPCAYEDLATAYQGLADYSHANAVAEKGLAELLKRHPDKANTDVYYAYKKLLDIAKADGNLDAVAKYGKETIISAAAFGPNQTWRNELARSLANYLTAHNRTSDAAAIAKLAP